MASFRRAFPVLGAVASVIGGGIYAINKFMSSAVGGGSDIAAAPGDAEWLAPIASSLPWDAITGEGQTLDGTDMVRSPSAAGIPAPPVNTFMVFLCLCWAFLVVMFAFAAAAFLAKAMLRSVSRAAVVRLAVSLMVLNSAWMTAGEWLNLFSLVATLLPSTLAAVLVSWMPVLRIVGAFGAAIWYLRCGLVSQATSLEGLTPLWVVKAWSLEKREYLDATEQSMQTQRELKKTREALGKAETNAAGSAASLDLLASDAREASEALKTGRQDLIFQHELLGRCVATLQRGQTLFSKCLNLLVSTTGKLYSRTAEMEAALLQLAVVRGENESLRRQLEATRSSPEDKSARPQLMQARALHAASAGMRTQRRPTVPSPSQSAFTFSVPTTLRAIERFPRQAPPQVSVGWRHGFRAQGTASSSSDALGVLPTVVSDDAPGAPSESPSVAASQVPLPPSPAESLSQDRAELVDGADSSAATSICPEVKVCWSKPGVPCSRGSGCIGNPQEYDEQGEFLRGREGRYGATGPEGKKRKQQARKQRLCADCFVQASQS